MSDAVRAAAVAALAAPPAADIRTALAELLNATSALQAWQGPSDGDISPLSAKYRSAEQQARAALAAPPAAPGLSPSEAVYGFAAWLTCRSEPVTFGSAHDAALPAELVDAFCKSQGLAPPGEQWPHNLKPTTFHTEQSLADIAVAQEASLRKSAAPAEPAALSDEEISAVYRETFGFIDSRLVGPGLEFARAVIAADRKLRGQP